MVSVVRDGPDTASYDNLPVGSPSARQTSTTATNVGTVTSATITVASTAGATVGYPITVIGTTSATDTATVLTVVSATQVTASKALTVTSGQTVTFGSAIPVTATSGLPSGGFNNGFKWTISFIQNVGNLRMLEASAYRYEVQHLWTTGGSPTPLNGQLILSYGGDSATVNFDASADELQAALESMPSVGDVEVTADAPSGNGQFSWQVTFRGLIGNIDLLGVDDSLLMGSDATIHIAETTAGSAATLVGPRPRLQVLKKSAGKPDYTSTYSVDTPGSYLTSVSQLLQGGLMAQYYDNEFQYGDASIERVDSQIYFDWGTGFITDSSADYVSVHWVGKIMVPVSEMFTFYLTSDDSATLNLNHSMLINASDVCCVEHRAHVFLQAGTYYDLSIDYVELTGAASIFLQYSSPSIKKQTVPSSALFYTMPIVGSPFTTTVNPGVADYPYTDAYGSGLTASTAGVLTTFFVQVKDVMGNNKTTDFELVNPVDLLQATIQSTSTKGVQYFADLEYLGQGLFKGSYTPLFTGNYTLSIQMGGQNGRDIYCGLGAANACSPFSLFVAPGPTVPQVSEIESPAISAMDYLQEAVVGEVSSFYIQAKDAFGNNQISGGDVFNVKLTNVGATFAAYTTAGSSCPGTMGTGSLLCITSVSSGLVVNYMAVSGPGISTAAPVTLSNCHVSGGSGYCTLSSQQSVPVGTTITVGSPNLLVRGQVTDNNDGTYLAQYTLRVAGTYFLEVTMASADGLIEEPLQHCVGPSSPYIFSRAYDGLNHYAPVMGANSTGYHYEQTGGKFPHRPNNCYLPSYTPLNAAFNYSLQASAGANVNSYYLENPLFRVKGVHNDLDARMTTYDDAGTDLVYATVGVGNSFVINARDEFGNLRSGDKTTHFLGYGSGYSDYFLVEFSQPETGDVYTVSSAVDVITIKAPSQGSLQTNFRLSFGGRTTLDIPYTISATGLEAVLERLHDFKLNVQVAKSFDSTAGNYIWRVMFLSMLDVWQSLPPAAGVASTGMELKLVPALVSTNDLLATCQAACSITRDAQTGVRGVYPVSFTLWRTGMYTVRITNNGIDIAG